MNEKFNQFIKRGNLVKLGTILIFAGIVLIVVYFLLI